MIEVPGYRVARELGRGGMATVYLAVQESLRREVALKVMAPEMARDREFAERFLREARLVASMHHRNIVAVYDVGTVDDVPYLAMEYLPAGAIPPLAGRCDAATALRCVREIADALDYAHDRGIVHRDIKLENILRHEDGSFLLGDFGIARVVGAATVRTLEGLTLGTPHYMAPERWTGAQFDGRADLYSLGVVLYALACGRMPYAGEDVWAVAGQHREAPIPQLPAPFEPLQGLLAALLAKAPEDRAPTGAAVVAHVDALVAELGLPVPGAGHGISARVTAGARTDRLLQEWPFRGGADLLTPRREPWWRRHRAALVAAVLASGAAVLAWRLADRDAPGRAAPPAAIAAPAASVAVLPFGHLPDDAGAAQIADVLADELLTQLARYPGLVVAARSSAFALRSRDLPVQEIGRTLGVAHVLEASLRREGERIHLGVRLVDATSGLARWADSYVRTPDELWQLEHDLAARIAASVLGQVDLARGEGPATAPGGQAYARYLQGRQLLAQPASVATLDAARARFTEALAADPAFARASAGICRVELRRFELSRDPADQGRAREACGEAAARDPELREVALAQGELARLSGDQGAALEFYRRAAEDAVLRPDAYTGLAKAYAALGEEREAEQHFELARRLQPGYWKIHADLGAWYLQTSQFAKAAQAYGTAISLSPEPAARLHSNLGVARFLGDDFAGAAEAYAASLAIERTPSALSNTATARFHNGEFEAAAALYREALALNPGDYRLMGNLADALSQVPGREAEAREAYARAADAAQAYLAAQPDAIVTAQELAWFLANLDESERARALLGDGGDATASAEGALRLAWVRARLGEREAAARQVRAAIDLGVSPRLVAATPWLADVLPADGARAIEEVRR